MDPNFDPFRGYSLDQSPSYADVAKRKALAETLLGNKVKNGSALGALADALAGTASAYEGSQAATEEQAGLTDANSQLAAALTGDGSDPASLLSAGGNPFLPQAESGLVGDMLKKKLGLGQVYGNSMPYLGQDGKLHFAGQTNYGGTVDLPAPGGGDWLAPVTYQNTGTNLVPTDKFALGNAPGGLPGGATPLPINNAQAESDKSYGGEVGKIVAGAPEVLQKTGQTLELLNRQADTTASAIDDAISKIQSNPTLMAGTLGSFLKAVPGNPAYDLSKTLTTINANQVIGTLNQMKANSPTGATGMGQVSNFEDELLSSMNGSADQGQTGAQLVANLQKMKGTLNSLKEDRNQAFAQDKIRLMSAPPAPPIIGANTGLPMPPPSASQQPSKVIGGVTYVQDANGDWYQQ